MSELRPFTFDALLRRLRSELDAGAAVFGLERKDWHLPRKGLDLSWSHGGRRAANPLGPAAGPHTQLAQNMVQGYLAGARVFELKTLQVLDRLSIPRPCIHAPHYALNVEWSQELALAESVREYQKTAWLLDLLRRTRAGGALPGHADLDFMLDLSVGYSLEGLGSPTMLAALDALRHPQQGYEELHSGLDDDLRAFAGPPPEGPVATCITLSTFHGCPPGEIGAMARLLLDKGWHVIIKLNPTLLGLERVRHILHTQLGYHHLEPDPAAFEQDLRIEGALELLDDLRGCAAEHGRDLGVKFTNTLVLKRDNRLFPEEAGPHMYLSGLPLHPLALATAALVSHQAPQGLSFSFSAGVDRHNAADLLACGLTPLTLCTDLLRRGGQGRLSAILAAVEERLVERGCTSLTELKGGMPEAPSSMEQERSERLTRAAEAAAGHPRYGAGQVMKAPRKLGSPLQRLDCISCDICLPVCPNGALFTWTTPHGAGKRPAQIGVLADACNACSNCETWCPELGSPWRIKERWHQDVDSLLASPPELDGSCRVGQGLLLRVNGQMLVYRPASTHQREELSFVTDALLPDEPSATPCLSTDLLERARLIWNGLATQGGHPVHALGLGVC